MTGRRLRVTRRRLVAAAVAVGVVATAGTVAVASGEDAPVVTETPLVVDVGPEPDGTAVQLDASVLTADGATGRRPAVVLAHGFGGSKDDVAALGRTLAEQGYVAVTFTARGFGASGGRIHLDSPDYEVADVSVLIDLLAERDDVQLDADDDPRVGLAGGSYGGAVALLAAGYDDRVDAVVPAITWNDLGQSLFPQSALDGDQPVADPGVFKSRWSGVFFAAGLSGPPADGPGADPAQAGCGRFDPTLCALYGQAAASGRPSTELLEVLRRSSPADVLDRVTAPTLLLQGEQDSLFGLDQADATATTLAAGGTTVAVRWIDGGHDASGASAAADELADAGLVWFDEHLRDGPAADRGFRLAVPVTGPGADGPEQLETPGYPGLVDDPLRLPLPTDPLPVLSPPGGQPAAITALPGTAGVLTAAAAAGAGTALAVLPGQAAVVTTAPLDEAVVVAGSPRVRLSVTSSTTDATLFASVLVAAPDGTTTLPRGLVAPLRLDGLTPGVPREVDVALPSSAYRVEAGGSLRVVVASTDAGYAGPADGRSYVVAPAGDAVLLVPVLAAAEVVGGARTGVPVGLLVAVGALLVAAGVLAVVTVVRRRRDARTGHDAALADVPLVVDGLVKAYANGFRAVDGVSWRAERGQVVGLLGPNGAGKTTTMRMLVGLIRADGGTIHVLGEQVVAGAGVLRRVGALIEGPGFLPHLTGRQNLEAWWAATGRPAAEADLEAALDVAALGTAVERPVRSYSQGMRQRLGIAQAMLGRPELLLLDEPTNGLDPPQIRAMRQVLADYAAAGRTVVVSSHLLAEVEQTCSHVVVMHRGRVVRSGAVPDLLVDARPDDGSPRSSRHLEEVFMGLIGDGEPVQSQVGS